MDVRFDKDNDRTGYWSPRTSAVDWCEENYEVSFYVAEFWNTITNLFFVVLGLHGMVQAIRDKTELRAVCSYGILVCLGLGSFVYHATLLFSTQMMDRVPMMWTLVALIYCLWESHSPPRSSNPMGAVGIFIIMMVLTLLTSDDDPFYFFIVFSLSLVVGIALTAVTLRTHDCNPRYLKIAFVFYILALCSWTLDRFQCPTLRSIRYQLPTYVWPLLQLHAWWHVFTCLAAAFHTVFVSDLRYRYLRRNTTYKKKWGIFPLIQVDESTASFP